jgi:hypothetical protein
MKNQNINQGLSKVFMRILINMFALLGLIAFLVGFRHRILQARSEYEWLGTFCLAVGLAPYGLDPRCRRSAGRRCLGED